MVMVSKTEVGNGGGFENETLKRTDGDWVVEKDYCMKLAVVPQQ